MLEPNQIEQIIRLIHKGFSLKLISLELDIPLSQIQACAEQLELRRFAKQSIKSGKVSEAIEKLNNFVSTAEYNIIERTILVKLQAYVNGASSDEELKEIQEEAERIGFHKNIDELLEKLDVQIPRKKNCNIKKKTQLGAKKTDNPQEISDSSNCKQETKKATTPNYEQTIRRYKEEIARNPQKSLNKRNLLAFAYFKSDRIDEARNELISLIDEHSSYMAYRQLIYLEKSQGNFQDARLWTDACLEQFPNNKKVKTILNNLISEEER